MNKKITVELTEKQLVIINRALDLYYGAWCDTRMESGMDNGAGLDAYGDFQLPNELEMEKLMRLFYTALPNK